MKKKRIKARVNWPMRNPVAKPALEPPPPAAACCFAFDISIAAYKSVISLGRAWLPCHNAAHLILWSNIDGKFTRHEGPALASMHPALINTPPPWEPGPVPDELLVVRLLSCTNRDDVVYKA